VDDASFFNFFKTVNLEDKGGLEKISEEELAKLEEKMAIDYDIARAIIDELLPYSLEYYLGVRNMNDLKTKDDEKEEEDVI
jgi:nucleosome assembly protein 1-like 1